MEIEQGFSFGWGLLIFTFYFFLYIKSSCVLLLVVFLMKKEIKNYLKKSKLSHLLCTKRTSELEGKNILHIMIETKARLQLMVRDVETIKGGTTYRSMEASKTEERRC